jgi:flagellar hook-associated protein 3 FlgL
MIRAATLPQSQVTLAQTMNSQRHILDLQNQISTGQVSRDYAGLGSDSHRLVSLETAAVRAEQYSANIKQVDQRLQAMETSVSSIFDTATRFRTLLISALSSQQTAEVPTQIEATNAKQEVANMLNLEHEGRFLFAGTRSTRQPVTLQGWTPPAMPLAAPLASYAPEYYRGDDVKLGVEADVGVNIQYGMTADEPAFEYVLRAMHYVEIAGQPADRTMLETALALVNTALGVESGNGALGVDAIQLDLTQLRAVIGASRNGLEVAQQRIDDFKLYTEENISSIEHVDVTEAMTRLATTQTQLEASYMTLSKLSQLSLTDYLR